ncbi:hydrogen peroxide-inducible genes activator [Jannaschia donghaensis]|uniref:Morphology and auto-aggregation control protein n=1 Tax=Jannaschia donghaensis TaxID=420998 RepID=A0A0M6YDQ8_9RHOB|nr:hydrogen peroxide-inducible genes activator [Jannaschia donghaensis]CTQ48074.1 Morphology and auto-aggregation control protein [Jannaschia donghaensis]
MANLTLKHLRYFEALARHGHFGRAAEASAISQPALSVQIKELETTLGATLFERSPRNVRLTAFGETFATRARDILRAVDELGDLARVSQGQLSGRLRLGVIPTVAPYLLPPVIAGLAATYPALDLDIRETITPKLLEELSDGRLDAAIVALPVSEPSLTETALFTEDFVLVRPAADADRPMPAPDQLHTMRLLLLEEGHCFRDQALSVCALPAGRPRTGLDGSSLSTLVQMVGAGIGVTLIPEMAVATETRAAPVSIGRFPRNTPKRTIGMVWRGTTPLAPQLTAMSAVVRQALKPAP